LPLSRNLDAGLRSKFPERGKFTPMSFIPFHDVFPDIAAKQIQTIQVDKTYLGVPLGEYGMVHAFLYGG
jgi:hypothetical protein